ncbi:alpha/beta-type small acid-soluble spore protein [Paenibacillus alkalitolerans]|uniref:alpha/beta-type small acid-soluble spore protein n=1 Tax=Paenibacillus alkalitolerans TaxID=2799335 RepID=UPI0018F6CF9F|nr:alpha/beta-type small acid-soluble spore protein [Paenibacillus alkalitolerans]
MPRRNVPVVPQAINALEQLKYESAREVGVQVPPDGYWGHVAARDAGAVGGSMVRKMVQIAEQTLAGRR